MEGVALLLISPGLVHRRCEESLAALRGKRERMGVPVLKLLSAAVKEGLLHEEEVGVVLWPINIEGLARAIEGALEVSTHYTRRAGTLQRTLPLALIHPSAWKGCSQKFGTDVLAMRYTFSRPLDVVGKRRTNRREKHAWPRTAIRPKRRTRASR